LQNLNDLKSRLLADEYFDTQLLFVSPSGDDTTTLDDYFRHLGNQFFDF
jgi:hypothetical protein